MKIRIFQKGFNYMQDGPGNRLVYHLAGCNMHCPWCSNPEGMAAESEFVKEYEVEALVEEAVSCRPMFFEGGGVTLTGGEVCMQLSAVSELLGKLKSLGIKTAVETNATHPHFSDLFEVTDYLITDYKHYDNAKLFSVCGIGNEMTSANLMHACEKGMYPHIRIPLIGGFNASVDDISGFIAFFVGLKRNGFDVELLPYHEYGRDKWSKIGKEYTVENGFVTAERVEDFRRAFLSAGIKVIKT